MADQFQTEVCGENWWNSGRTTFGLSPCASAFNDIGSCGWPSDLVDLKARSSYESESLSESDGSLIFQDIAKPQPPDSIGRMGNTSLDSTLQMMDVGLSSSTTRDWNQALHSNSGRAESNYDAMLRQDLSSSLGFDRPEIHKEWTPKNFPISTENQDFSMEQQPLNSITHTSDGTQTCQGLSTSFPVSSASYGYNSTLLQPLFSTDLQPQSPVFESRSMNCLSMTNLKVKPNELLPSSLPTYPSFLTPSLPKQRPVGNQHFSDNTATWNSSTAALDGIRAGLLSSSQSPLLLPTLGSKPNCANLSTKISNDQIRDSAAASMKSNNEPPFKRPRIETPSPLPTFKVRKEKLGDRITALQQLVSPFGKTDTASVLHEAIDYIKFLHDQVMVLSTPYMKNGNPNQLQQMAEKVKDQDGQKKDLRSRGLCLVPISSTFPVAAETTADFWTPTFGATFR